MSEKSAGTPRVMTANAFEALKIRETIDSAVATIRSAGEDAAKLGELAHEAWLDWEAYEPLSEAAVEAWRKVADGGLCNRAEAEQAIAVAERSEEVAGAHSRKAIRKSAQIEM